jgi:hypothetical protein
MKKTPYLLFVFLLALSCSKPLKTPVAELTGTWKLQSGTLIENGDTTVTDYTGKVSFIKIINGSHFAFLQHDLNKGADSIAVFVAGGGKYTLKDSLYTEHLEYCSDRAWEGNDFSFTVTIRNDTLVQRGVEIVEARGINRENTEVYIRQQ